MAHSIMTFSLMGLIATLSIMSLSIISLSIMSLSIMSLSITSLNIMSLSIVSLSMMSLSIKKPSVSIYWVLYILIAMLSVIIMRIVAHAGDFFSLKLPNCGLVYLCLRRLGVPRPV
jgi:hypothetical protein